MDQDHATTDRPVEGSVLLRLLAMAVTGLVLYLLAVRFRALDCWVLFFAVAVTAWPLWLYQRDVSLFARRLWLTGVTREDSAVRRWLWAGHISQTFHAALALGWAALLLALTTLLQPVHWTVLAADVLFLSLLINPVRRSLAGQVHAAQIGTVARRWPLFALNLTFLTIAFVLVDFFVVGSPDTRGMAWHQVAEQTFDDVAGGASCAVAGWLAATLAVAERLAWHASLLVIPSLSEPLLRISAWAAVLVHAGLLAFLFTRMQLGIVTWLESRSAGSGRREGPFPLAFVFTILALALPSLYLALTPVTLEIAPLQQAGRGVVEWTNPCRGGRHDDDSWRAEIDSDLAAVRDDAVSAAGRAMAAELDTLFDDVDRAIEAYLDWYFTVIGEYERLAGSLSGDVAGSMAEMLQHHLFDKTRFGERLAEASSQVEARSIAHIAGQAERVRRQLADAIAAQPCRVESTNPEAMLDLGRDRVRATIAAGGGVIAGAATAKLLAQSTVATLAGKVAAKKGFQAAAGLAGKAAMKKGGSLVVSAATAAAICSPSGPMAVICGVVAGVATWLAADKVMIEIDEALFRDEMRSEIRASLAESRAQLENELKQRHIAVIDHATRVVADGVDRVFIPARDGL